jgi:hypothetical protein
MACERLVKRHPAHQSHCILAHQARLLPPSLSLWNRALLYGDPYAGSMDHPFNKSLFDNDDSAFHAPFVRTDVLSSQHRQLRGELRGLRVVLAPGVRHTLLRC